MSSLYTFRSSFPPLPSTTVAAHYHTNKNSESSSFNRLYSTEVLNDWQTASISMLLKRACKLVVALTAVCMPVGFAQETTLPSVDGRAQEANPTLFTEINTGVFVRFGSHKAITRHTVDRIANHGFIIGEDSVAVIDPGGSEQQARNTIEKIAKITPLPISHVVITHVHPDHSLGISTYVNLPGDQPPGIIGHPSLSNELRHNSAYFTETFTTNAEQLTPLLDLEMITPVDKPLTIDLGNHPLTIYSFDPAHSRSDIVVFDHTTSTLWAGDLLFVNRLPVLDGSLRGWLQAMKSLDKLMPESVIPGHGGYGSWNELSALQTGYLKSVEQETLEAIQQGLSLKHFIDKSTLSINFSTIYGKNTVQHKRNLSRVFTELEWE